MNHADCSRPSLVERSCSDHSAGSPVEAVQSPVLSKQRQTPAFYEGRGRLGAAYKQKDLLNTTHQTRRRLLSRKIQKEQQLVTDIFERASKENLRVNRGSERREENAVEGKGRLEEQVQVWNHLQEIGSSGGECEKEKGAQESRARNSASARNKFGSRTLAVNSVVCLELVAVSLDTELVSALCASRSWFQGLQYLDLSYNDLTCSDTKRVAKAFIEPDIWGCEQQLRGLSLRYNQIRDEGATHLAQALAKNAAFPLRFAQASPSSCGTKSCIKEVYLEGNRFTEASHCAFGESLLVGNNLVVLNTGEIQPSFKVSRKALEQYFDRMEAIASKISSLYSGKSTTEHVTESEDHLLNKGKLAAMSNKMKMLDLIQTSERALMKGCVMRTKVLKQNETLASLDSKANKFRNQQEDALRAYQCSETLRSDESLFRKLKKVDSLPALRRLYVQLQRKVKLNQQLISEKEQHAAQLEDDLQQLKKLFSFIGKQERSLKEEKEALKALNEKILTLEKEKKVSKEKNQTIIEKLMKRKTGLDESNEKLKKEVDRARNGKEEETGYVTALQKKLDEMIEDKQVMNEEIILLKQEVLRLKNGTVSSSAIEKGDRLLCALGTKSESVSSQSPRRRTVSFSDQENVMLDEAGTSVESRGEVATLDGLVKEGGFSIPVRLGSRVEECHVLQDGDIFAFREKYSMFWKSPRHVWVSEDLNFLCMVKGTCKDQGLFVTKFYRKFIKVRRQAEQELEDVDTEAQRQGRNREGSESSWASSRSGRTTGPFHRFNRGKTNDWRRIMQLTVYETKMIDDREVIHSKAGQINRGNLTKRRILLRAETIEQKNTWERALNWWLSAGSQKKGISKPLQTFSSDVTDGETIGEVSGDTVKAGDSAGSASVSIQQGSPGTQVQRKQNEVISLSTEQQRDPALLSGGAIDLIVKKIRCVVDRALQSTMQSSPDLASESSDRQSLNITYKNVREAVEEEMEASFLGDTWKAWFRTRIDSCLEEYEDSEEDEDL